MKKTITILSLVALMAGGLFAQTTQTVNMTVNLSPWYDLSFSRTSLIFNDVQPTISATPGTESIPAEGGAVAVRAFAVAKKSETLSLTVTGNANLTAGSESIGIGAISWEATSGAGYAGGTMALTSVTAGSWTNSVLHWHEGSFTYKFLRDYTTQAPGAYTATATYTLSAI